MLKSALEKSRGEAQNIFYLGRNESGAFETIRSTLCVVFVLPILLRATIRLLSVHSVPLPQLSQIVLTVLRIRDVYPGSRCSNPGSKHSNKRER